MALDAIGGSERLILVGLLKALILGIMAIDAKRGRGFGQMKIELLLAAFAGLVGDVAGFTAHVEGRMAAAFFGDVEPRGVTAQTKIFFFAALGGLQELEFIVRLVRIVAFQTITPGR